MKYQEKFIHLMEANRERLFELEKEFYQEVGGPAVEAVVREEPFYCQEFVLWLVNKMGPLK